MITPIEFIKNFAVSGGVGTGNFTLNKSISTEQQNKIKDFSGGVLDKLTTISTSGFTGLGSTSEVGRDVIIRALLIVGTAIFLYKKVLE